MWLTLKRAGLAMCAGLALSACARGQHLVQAVTDGLSDPVVAREASQLVQQQPGVLMARFDVRTRNVMLHVAEDCTLNASSLNALLLPLGVQLRCYQRRDAREGVFRHLESARCTDHPTLNR
jgi:hypothetical protein